MKTDTYIEILKYGRDKLNTGFSADELLKHLKEQNLSLYPDVETQIDHTAFGYIIMTSFQTHECYQIIREDIRSHRASGLFIKPESLTYLINNEMLQETQRTATLSQKTLKWAIIIGIVSIGCSLFQTIFH